MSVMLVWGFQLVKVTVIVRKVRIFGNVLISLPSSAVVINLPSPPERYISLVFTASHQMLVGFYFIFLDSYSSAARYTLLIRLADAAHAFNKFSVSCMISCR